MSSNKERNDENKQAKSDSDLDEDIRQMRNAIAELKEKIAQQAEKRKALEMFNYTSKFAQEFEVTDILGSGKYGLVMQAKDIRFEQLYAVKRIAVTQNKLGETLKEAKIFSGLDHSGIVRYNYTWTEEPPPEWQKTEDKKMFLRFKSKEKHQQDYNELSTFIYIQMQLCRCSLTNWLDDNPTTETRPLTLIKLWLKQLVSGIGYLHDRGYIHRDLKPCNILVFERDRLKICDMGTAIERKIEDGVEQTIERGSGTWDYMSPEQFSLFYEIDSKTDVFSLGLIFTELCVAMEESRKREVFNNFRSGVTNPIFGSDKKTEEFISYLTEVERHKRPSCQALLYLTETFLDY